MGQTASSSSSSSPTAPYDNPYALRSTWQDLSSTALTAKWHEYISASPPLREACPKVGTGFFQYPSLAAPIRGAKALEDIRAGEVFCRVPVHMLLSVHSVRNSSLHPVAAHFEHHRNAAGRDLERALIAIFALRESARVRSPYMPYMQILNTHATSSIPMLWSPNSSEYRRLSKGAMTIARRERAAALDVYQHVMLEALSRFATPLSDGLPCAASAGSAACSRAALSRVYSRDEFMRMYVIIGARDWVLSMYGKTTAFCAPIMDMLNFGQIGIRVAFDDRQNAFVARATKPIAKGSEMLFFYGSFCVDTWLSVYGFVPDGARPCSETKRGGARQSAIH